MHFRICLDNLLKRRAHTDSAYAFQIARHAVLESCNRTQIFAPEVGARKYRVRIFARTQPARAADGLDNALVVLYAVLLAVRRAKVAVGLRLASTTA